MFVLPELDRRAQLPARRRPYRAYRMDINTTICVADLQLPENVKAVYDQNFAIVSVLSKAKDAAEEAAE